MQSPLYPQAVCVRLICPPTSHLGGFRAEPHGNHLSGPWMGRWRSQGELQAGGPGFLTSSPHHSLPRAAIEKSSIIRCLLQCPQKGAHGPRPTPRKRMPVTLLLGP